MVFLFAPRMSYNEFRSIVSKFGYVWLCQATAKRARYAVKYVVKDLNTSNYDVSDALRITGTDIFASILAIRQGNAQSIGKIIIGSI